MNFKTQRNVDPDYGHADNGKEQKVIVHKLISVFPLSGYISDLFKGAKPKSITSSTRTLRDADF
jgi:hypothetical protein